MAKNLILDLILACLAQIWAPKNFSQVLALKIVRHCSKPSFLPNFGSLAQTWATKKIFVNFTSTRCQKDENDFIRRCLTNVERPKSGKTPCASF